MGKLFVCMYLHACMHVFTVGVVKKVEGAVGSQGDLLVLTLCWSLRLYLRGFSGTAGRQSSLATHGTGFSTRDQDNDNCEHCKCAPMLTGGNVPSSVLRHLRVPSLRSNTFKV